MQWYACFSRESGGRESNLTANDNSVVCSSSANNESRPNQYNAALVIRFYKVDVELSVTELVLAVLASMMNTFSGYSNVPSPRFESRVV